jgi:uncharacterized protein
MLAYQLLSKVEAEQAVDTAAWKNQQYQCGDCLYKTVTRLPLQPICYKPEMATSVPKRYPELFRKKISQGYVAAYNPAGCAGVVVLNSALAELLEEIDGERSCRELALYLEWPLREMVQAINKLEGAELIYTGAQPPAIKFGQSRAVTAWLHVTNQCNLRCKYCYISKTSQQMPLNLGKQALDEIFASALRHQQEEVVLKISGGEALAVFPLVQELIAYARQLGKEKSLKVQPVILTNGTLITPEMAQFFKAEGCLVMVSLDGLAEYNDITRPTLGGQGSFRQIECGLQLLEQAEVAFHISVVVSKYNLIHLPELTRYLLERNLSFTFNFFRENELASSDLSVENEQLTEWLSLAYDVIAKLLPAYSLMNAILDRVQFNQPHLQACGAGKNYIVVKHTGEIVGCQMHMQKPGIGQIGQGHDLLQIIRQSNFIPPEGRESNTKESCSHCQWRYVCAGGCPIMALAAYGRYNTRSPFCETYQVLIPRVIELEAVRILKYARPL